MGHFAASEAKTRGRKGAHRGAPVAGPDGTHYHYYRLLPKLGTPPPVDDPFIGWPMKGTLFYEATKGCAPPLRRAGAGAAGCGLRVGVGGGLVGGVVKRAAQVRLELDGDAGERELVLGRRFGLGLEVVAPKATATRRRRRACAASPPRR